MVVGVDAQGSLTFVRVPQGATQAGAAALEAALGAACAPGDTGGAGADTQQRQGPPQGAGVVENGGAANGAHADGPSSSGRGEAGGAAGPALPGRKAGGKGPGAKGGAVQLPNMGARPLQFDPLQKISKLAAAGVDIAGDGHAARADPDSLPPNSG